MQEAVKFALKARRSRSKTQKTAKFLFIDSQIASTNVKSGKIFV